MNDHERDHAAGDSLEAWRGEFMEAAARHTARRRRKWPRTVVAPLAVLAVVGAGGVATASMSGLIGGDPPQYKGETLGYMNLQTGEPIRCPNGELLTYTPGDDGRYGPASCDDGSVPEVYARQLNELLKFGENAKFGTPVSDGPNFAFDIDEGTGQPAR